MLGDVTTCRFQRILVMSTKNRRRSTSGFLPMLLRYNRYVSSSESTEFFIFLLDNQVFVEVKIAVFEIAGNCAQKLREFPTISLC